MPYTNVPEELWGKMDDCKDKVMAEGHDEQSAIAICHASIMGGKSLEDATKEFILDAEVKVGARHSRSDTEALQAIHDGAIQLGAVCPPQVSEVTEIPMRSIDDETIVFYGDAVKALGDGKLGGYLVRFTSDIDPDLTGEYFDKDTDYGDFTHADVYYHHGMDIKMGKRKLSKGTLVPDDVGVWIEAQLALRDEYEKAIYELAEAGKLGWSSGTASHLVDREQKGNAQYIKSWPLGLDASLTPTPAEPRNSAIPLKSYLSAISVSPLIGNTPQPETQAEAPAGASVEQEGEPQATDDPQPILEVTENTKMEITEEKLQELMVAAATKALQDLPAKPTDVKVEKDVADQPWASPGEYFQAVKTACLYPQSEDPRLRPLKAGTGLSEGVPSDGGYLLADQIAAGVLERMHNTGQILSRVANQPIGANSNGLVVNAVDETSRVDGSRWGGILGYWLAEAGTKTGSHPTFAQLTFKLKKVAALCYATDELLDDATALGGWLNRTVPEELRFQVEESIYNGNGVGKPLGIMNSPALVSVLRLNASNINSEDVIGMWARRWVGGGNNYVWLINQDIIPELLGLTLGTYNMMYMPPGGLSVAPYGTLMGKPVIEVEYAATMGTTGDIMLVDLSQYQIITKGGIQSASSIHVNFLNDESVFRFVYRVDGQPLWKSTLTPFKGSNTQSPFVVLATASA